MQNIISYLNSVLDTYWGQSRYQMLLYLSIGIILLVEKKFWKKATFAWYAILCFIGLMNPLTVKITSRIWGGNVAYYCRQISLIPIFVIIAYGMVLALRRFREKYKILIVVCVSLCICVNGQIIYGEGWYTKAENFNKIPDEVIEIADFFQNQEKNIRVAAPTSLSVYFRQYYNIIQLQGRYANNQNIETELQSDEPDADAVMQYAGENECDYIVVKGQDDIRNIYETAGYTECLRTQNYLVYKVEGVERWECIYNDKNQMVEKIYLDKNNCVISSSMGYAIVKYTYDLKGNILSEHYFDRQGEKVALYSGEYGVSYQYDEKGHKTQIAYLDENDDLLMPSAGYALEKNTYDDAGRIAERIFFDENGNRVNTQEGYASILFTYNDAEDSRYEQYYDENQNPVVASAGQYGILRKNSEGRTSQVTYLDENGNPMISSYGYATVQYTYDENGNTISEHYFDAEDKPVSLSLGEYGVIYEYQNNILIEKEYIDDNNQTFNTKFGFARVEYIYDSSGNNVGEKYYDLSGNEIILD